MKRIGVLILSVAMILMSFGCTTKKDDKKIEQSEKKNILVAAAASLKNAYENDLIPMFEEKYPEYNIEGTYDSSGKLQTQIEEGLEADIFMSAAMKQVNNLVDKGIIEETDVVELLVNEIVLIANTEYTNDINKFEDIVKAENIVIGDPDSVPVGQYSKEALINLDVWEQIENRLSLATNVTEVLNQVASAGADCGIVYATDVASNDSVKILAKAPEGCLKTEVVYPVAKIKNSANKEAAQIFVDFLKSEEALEVFSKYGFTIR